MSYADLKIGDKIIVHHHLYVNVECIATVTKITKNFIKTKYFNFRKADGYEAGVYPIWRIKREKKNLAQQANSLKSINEIIEFCEKHSTKKEVSACGEVCEYFFKDDSTLIINDVWKTIESVSPFKKEV